jgi:CheY-like chemotaxis protein
MELALPTGAPVVEESFRSAKIDHYLDRVEELVSMARYCTARLQLAKVFELDPQNRAALTLQQHIDVVLRQLAAPVVRPMNGHPKTARRSERVLVVDQDERILTTLAHALRKYGFTALGAASFDEAVETITRCTPSMIISEVNFEKGPVGFDLYVWIRNNGILSAIPFLFLATRVTRDMFIAGKRMGVDEFIVKPLDEEVVLASVINCLWKRKRMR